MVLVPKGSDEAAAKKSADDLLASVKSGKLKKETMIETQKKVKQNIKQVMFMLQEVMVLLNNFK